MEFLQKLSKIITNPGNSIKISVDSFESKTAWSDKEKHQQQTRKMTIIWSIIALFVLVLFAFMIIWVIIPIWFMCSLSFQTFMVFLPVSIPRNVNFDSPEDVGLEKVYNFYLPTRDYHDGSTWTKIGGWLILPENDTETISSTNINYILQNTKHDILFYLHGVYANRAKAINQYREFRKHFLVIAIDHRGYGDSGLNVRMSEAGIAHDHAQIYDWIRSINSESDIYYWGHSLGSALSTRTLKLLKEQKGMVPKGLILESPFTSLEDVVVNIVTGQVYGWLAYFDATVLRPLDNNGFHFRSRENILSIDCPVMILHAEDDFVVPYFLGEKLAREAKENRSSDQGKVLFHGISADFGYGHNDIIKHPEIGYLIDDFKRTCRDFH